MSDEATKSIGPGESFPRRYNVRQLSDPSFGYVVARFVCEKCGNRELAHGRRFADGSLYFLVPEPEGGRTRGMLVARKMRTGHPVDQMFIAFRLDEIPTDVPTILSCPKHGSRPLASQLILSTILEGKPTRPRAIGI